MSPTEVKRQLELYQTTLTKDLDDKGWRNHWKEIRDYLLPDRGYALDDSDDSRVNSGEKRRENIITSVAENAIANLAAGLKSYLTTPSRPWFALSMEDTDLNQVLEIEAWLEEVTSLLHRVFNATNFYEALHNTYIEFAGFGTGAMAIMSDEVDTIHCRALTCGEYAIGTNQKNKVDELVRHEWMTLRNISSQFGKENLPYQEKTFLEQGDHNAAAQRRRIFHLVVPNDGRLSVKPKGMTEDLTPWPYVSVYWMEGHADEPLHVGGFETFPYMVARWNVVGNNVYGTECPGFKELANIKGLYDMKTKEYIAAHKLIEPPVVTNGSESSINTLPGGISTGTNNMGGGMAIQPLYLIKPDMPGFELVLEKLREEVGDGFFNNLFLMIADAEGDRKTAFEVARLQEEKMSMLGPMIEKLNTDALEHAITRTIAIMARQNLLPEPPTDLSDTDFEIEYVSLLAQAQKTSALRSIDSFMLFFQQAFQINPGIADLIDWDATVEFYRDATGSPSLLMQDPETLAAIRQAQAQQEQAANAIQMGESLSASAKNLSESDMGGGENALQTLLGGGA